MAVNMLGANDFRFGTSPSILDSALTGPGITPSFGSLSRMTEQALANPDSPMGISGISGLGAPDSGLGFNMDTGKLALSGLATIGNLYAAFQANKLAKKQFNFQKDAYNTNLANSQQTYNTSIADRARSRGFVEGQDPGTTQAYIDANSLRRPALG